MEFHGSAIHVISEDRIKEGGIRMNFPAVASGVTQCYCQSKTLQNQTQRKNILSKARKN